MTNDFWLGCTYTLACIFAGILITLILVAILGDRGDPGPGPEEPPDPTPEELEAWLTEYEPVEDRLRSFWEDHPYGRVITELLHHADGDYIVLASVYFGNELRNDPPTATGLAHDSTSSLPNNMKASALEVCETSAIGRALANAGYAPKGKRPSREEMQKSERPEPAGDGEAPTGSGDRGGGVEPNVVDGSPASATHLHEWEKAPREGWAVCACGKAEKLTKVTIHTAPVEDVEIRKDLAT